MALIHAVHKHVHKSKDAKFLKMYAMMKFKMKLAYESWIKRIKLSELIHRAIFKTIIE